MKHNNARANTALKILKIYSGSLICHAVSSVLQYLSYKNFASNFDINDFTDANMPFRSFEEIGKLLQYQNIIMLLGLVTIGLFITNSITFIQWFRRSYYNLHQLEIIKPSYSAGMAAGAWWIPIGNLFIPATIFGDLWTGYNKYLGKDPKKSGSGIGAVWAIWVATWVILLIGGFYIASSTMGNMLTQASQIQLNGGMSPMVILSTITEMTYYMMFLSIVSTIFLMISGLLMTGVVKKISNLEDQALEKYNLA